MLPIFQAAPDLSVFTQYGLAGLVVLVFYLLMKNELSHIRDEMQALNENISTLNANITTLAKLIEERLK